MSLNQTIGFLYREKILNEIIQPAMHYYGVNYNNGIVELFCKALSHYDYNIIVIVRDELLSEYKTFPKLPNWIAKCKEKTTNGISSTICISKDLQKIIETNNYTNKNWLYVKEQLKKQYGDSTYNCWFAKLNLINESNDKVILSAETPFVEEWITKEYLNGVSRRIKNQETNQLEIQCLKKGIMQFWQDINPNIKIIEIRSITKIDKEFAQNQNHQNKQENGGDHE